MLAVTIVICLLFAALLFVRGRFPHLKKRAGELAVLLVWIELIALLFANRDTFSLDSVLEMTPDNVWLGALFIVLLFSLKSVSVVIYSGIIYAAAGILLPLPLAIAADFVGTAAMCTIPYLLGRLAASEVMDELFNKSSKLRQLQDFQTKNDFVFVLLVRLIQLFPSDLVSVYLGAAKISYKHYMPACLIGLLPGGILFTVMGTSIQDTESTMFRISLAVETALIVLPTLAYMFYRYRQRRLEKRAERSQPEDKQ